MFRLTIAVSLITATLSLASPSNAQDAPWRERRAFDRRVSMGVYGVGYAAATDDAYRGAGIGAKLGVRLLPHLAVEVFTDHLVMEGQGDDVRHDHPVGFNLVVPFTFGRFRLRPLAGFCASFSFIEHDLASTARSDTIAFGIHGGLGVEVELGRFFTAYLDVQQFLYVGDTRDGDSWASSATGEMSFFGVTQGVLGIAAHL